MNETELTPVRTRTQISDQNNNKPDAFLCRKRVLWLCPGRTMIDKEIQFLHYSFFQWECNDFTSSFNQLVFKGRDQVLRAASCLFLELWNSETNIPTLKFSPQFLELNDFSNNYLLSLKVLKVGVSQIMLLLSLSRPK